MQIRLIRELWCVCSYTSFRRGCDPIFTLPPGLFMSWVVIHVGKSISSLSTPVKLLFDLGLYWGDSRENAVIELEVLCAEVTQQLALVVFVMNTFLLSALTGARSLPRGLTCALSMWSTQRAGTVSCSASKRTRPGSWRPSRKAPGWNWSAR